MNAIHNDFSDMAIPNDRAGSCRCIRYGIDSAVAVQAPQGRQIRRSRQGNMVA